MGEIIYPFLNLGSTMLVKGVPQQVALLTFLTDHQRV